MSLFRSHADAERQARGHAARAVDNASLAARYAAALAAIAAEPAPVLPSPDDLLNVHIPGSYAERVKQMALTALEGD